METMREILASLMEGNERHVAGRTSAVTSPSEARRAELASAQHPVAAVLACADSRVPVEQIFDRGPGELFVVRVAGNVLGPMQAGSLEYALTALDVRVLVVLGHTGCGAVGAACAGAADGASPELRSVLEEILPAIDGGCGSAREAEEANVRRATAGARALAERAAPGVPLLVCGLIFDIATGRVAVVDAPPGVDLKSF